MGKLVGSIVAGVIAGVIGAAVWGALAYWAHVEIGWVAWLIGGLVGFAVCVGGGEGNVGGLTAVAISVVAICAGKVAAVNYAIDDFAESLTENITEFIPVDGYNKLKEDAKEFAKVRPGDGYEEFMAKHGYSVATRPSEVTGEEISSFESNEVPILKRFLSDNPPTFEEYKQHLAFKLSLETHNVSSRIPFWEKLKLSMSWFDLIFFGLAIVTAYKLGFGGIRTTD